MSRSHMSAWIETILDKYMQRNQLSRSHMSAWIETF